MVWKCFGCCCERVPDWTGVVQWWVLIYSPRRAHLAQARITGTRPVFLLERSPRRGAVFWATNCLAQARRPRLSESSRNYPRATIAVSPKRESAAWARALFSPEQGLQLERDLFWVFAMLCFMNVDGCLIGWFIDLLYIKGVDMHVLCMLWVRTNELEMSLAWDIFDGWSPILNDMLMVCVRTSWLIDNVWVRFM